MKYINFFLFYLPFLVAAQPEFSFDLYFEDALGNRDTITLGYDPLATDGIDAQFGEENIISQPWDSVLDVRIGNKTYTVNTWLTDNTYLSKKQIISSYCDNSIISSRISIQFYAKNFPLKFKWDKSQFENDTCRFFSVFFGEIDYLNIDAINGTFLQFNDSLYININEQNEMNANFVSEIDQALTPYYYFLTYSTENKEIGVMQFVFYSFRAASLNDKAIFETKVFPNPLNSNSTLHISNGENYFLYNVHGNLLENSIIENNTLDLNNISSGVYFLQIENKGTFQTTKLIVL